MRSSVLLILVALLTTACAAIESAVRKPVPGVESAMISSQLPPKDSENCTKVAEVSCPYTNFTMKSAHDRCVEFSLEKAVSVNADYIYVDEPMTLNGISTSSPTSIMYTCTNLAELNK
ncbi:hypothetical protein [Microbulbifer sp. 2201CG32-9]|uniref:hypothetical protein n=1 Tax=unclassified Microbulbifer TaxID=2619833 RepID=UPI00345B63D3